MKKSFTLLSLFLISGIAGCGSDATAPAASPAISTVNGADQSGFAGDALPTPLAVRVTSGGTPMAGDTVHWQVVSGRGSLSAPFSITDDDGNASVVWTLGPDLGAQEVKAFVAFKTSSGISTTLAHFSATALHRDPTNPPEDATPKVSILHYDGSTWSVAYQKLGDPAIQLNSIWGTSPPSVFAVGSLCGTPVQMQFDGTEWSTPSGGCGGFNDVNSVSGSASSNVFVVSRTGMPMQIGSWITRYDGSAWTAVYNHSCSLIEGPCDPYLNAIWSGSPNLAVTVGDSGFVARYDGTAWKVDASGTQQHLRAVWGTTTGPTTSVFAVGDAGTILQFDGTTWQPQTSGTSMPLYAVWGTSATDVFAAGASGVILHYDGSSWSPQRSTGSTLHGLWGSSGNSVFAVGDGPSILHYDGSTWTPQTTSAAIDLRGVWGLSPTDVFAVGHPR